MTLFWHLGESRIRKLEVQICEPRDADWNLVELSFTDDAIVASVVKIHDDPVSVFNFDIARGFDKLSVDAFGFGMTKATQSCRKPAIAAVGNNGQHRV